MQFWFDAQDAASITTTGLGVSEWLDKSGNGRHATQTVDADRPSSGGDLNGKNGILFDSSNTEFMHLPDGALPYGNSSYHIFLVVKRLSPTVKWAGYICGGTSSVNSAIIIADGLHDKSYLLHNWDTNIQSVDGLAVGYVTIIEASYDGIIRTTAINGDSELIGVPGVLRTQGVGNNRIGHNWMDGAYCNAVYTASPCPGRLFLTA